MQPGDAVHVVCREVVYTYVCREGSVTEVRDGSFTVALMEVSSDGEPCVRELIVDGDYDPDGVAHEDADAWHMADHDASAW